MDSIKVRDHMNRHPLLLKADTPLSEIVAKLVEAKQMGAPVVNLNGALIGFVSEQDCLAKMVSATYHCEVIANAEDIMRTDVLTVDIEDSILQVASLMQEGKPKIYPVLENGQLVGVITRNHVLKTLSEHIHECYSKAV
ncbi:CBS domain-containing protein [Paraferrimonas sp. SM1919]|uniref:CBS domain-containing protein n=1 Tax=Paraferrimonas sp. SM1919 TaxID=2662263 RepID=UPI0013D13477|nr:CBS domain-containing protein [Paraferrimonas sp. SM1919]